MGREWTPNHQFQVYNARFQVYGLQTDAKSAIPRRDFERTGLEINTKSTITSFTSEISGLWVGIERQIINSGIWCTRFRAYGFGD